MKSWLKNGLRGIAVAAIIAVIIWAVIIVIYTPTWNYWGPPLYLIFSFPGVVMTAGALFKIYGYEIPDYSDSLLGGLLLTLPTIFSAVIYFLLGIFAGWIIRKIKSKS